MKIRSDAKKNMYQIVPQVPLHLVKPLAEKRSGLKFSYILSKDAIIPKGRKDLLQSLGMKELLHMIII